MSEFYVHLFSSTNQDLYPENSTSKFTVRLPKPLELDNNEWYVGLVDCSHPVILGTVEGQGEQDVVMFPEVNSVNTYTYDLPNLATFLLANSKRPEMYTRRYFHEFLDLDNLKDFNVSEKLIQHKVTPLGTSHKFKVFPFSILSQYRGDPTKKKYFLFESHRAYTMKQILYYCLSVYYDIFLEAETDSTVLGYYGLVKEGRSTAEMLQLLAMSFINSMRHNSLYFTNRDMHANFLLIYTDFIEPSICGNALSRLLLLTSRKLRVTDDLISVKNVKYYRVSKKYIETMSFLFADEKGSQILMENSWSPSSIVLHFRKRNTE